MPNVYFLPAKLRCHLYMYFIFFINAFTLCTFNSKGGPGVPAEGSKPAQTFSPHFSTDRTPNQQSLAEFCSPTAATTHAFLNGQS